MVTRIQGERIGRFGADVQQKGIQPVVGNEGIARAVVGEKVAGFGFPAPPGWWLLTSWPGPIAVTVVTCAKETNTPELMIVCRF